jgi:hypothetical protein
VDAKPDASPAKIFRLLLYLCNDRTRFLFVPYQIAILCLKSINWAWGFWKPRKALQEPLTTMHLSSALGLIALSYLSFATAQNVSISLPAAIPANATVLDPHLCSMSLEFQSLEYYAGDLGKPNQFTHNVVQNIVERVGQPPAVRYVC